MFSPITMNKEILRNVLKGVKYLGSWAVLLFLCFALWLAGLVGLELAIRAQIASERESQICAIRQQIVRYMCNEAELSRRKPTAENAELLKAMKTAQDTILWTVKVHVEYLPGNGVPDDIRRFLADY